MGRENVKNIQKSNKFVIVGGGGGFPSPKGPEKSTEHVDGHVTVSTDCTIGLSITTASDDEEWITGYMSKSKFYSMQ